MNILVCIKQVPDTTQVKIDPVKHTLIREGVPSIVSTFDTYAVETGLRLKEANGGKVTIVSMGPPKAVEAVSECLSVGADEGWLVSGRKFGGSDTLATSRILAEAVRVLEKKNGEKFDIIICGKQAIDGDTGQVGPEMAQHLGLPLITCAVEVTAEGDRLAAKRSSDEGYDIYDVKMPALITMDKPAYDMRYPSIKNFLKVYRGEVTVSTLTDEDVVVPEGQCGLKGSPTKVRKTFTPVHEKNGMKINSATAKEAASTLMDLLESAKLI